jgi:hypothetical protein
MALRLEGHAQGLTGATQDLAEGMAAMREKREPRFQGR